MYQIDVKILNLDGLDEYAYSYIVYDTRFDF